MDPQTLRILNRVAKDFDELLTNRRAVLLDTFEGLFGHTQHWDLIRKKLLKFVGDSGLRGDFFAIVDGIKRNGTENGNKDRAL